MISTFYIFQARNELISKVKQLGPFHVFLTLSCGELRWFDVFTTVLNRHGYDVIFEEDENGQWDGDEEKITVEGKQLWDFIDSLDKTKHDILRGFVYIVTMHFEQRVKSFISNILLGKGKDKVPIQYYSYRVEMQARGMPHIHLVAWIEKDFLEEMGIQGDLVDNKEATEALADLLVCCQLPSDEKFRTVVEEVQTHGHTNSCKKRSDTCRFNFPKFPSKKTIVARPFAKFSQLEKDQILQGEKEEEFLKRSKAALKLGKEFLKQFDDNKEGLSKLT